jgi:hypothetical protein
LPPIAPKAAWDKDLQRFAQQIGQKQSLKINALENVFSAAGKPRVFPGGTANCV